MNMAQASFQERLKRIESQRGITTGGNTAPRAAAGSGPVPVLMPRSRGRRVPGLVFGLIFALAVPLGLVVFVVSVPPEVLKSKMAAISTLVPETDSPQTVAVVQ